MSRRPIVVVGSANTDMIMQTPSIPKPGETVLGEQFFTTSGGKGANQAVALARIGKRPISFLACLGDDDFGKRAIDNYKIDGIDTSRIVIEKGQHSGVAFIFVAADGENSIGVSSGANAYLSPSHIDQNEDLISTAAMVLLQLETPLKTIERTILTCKRHNVPVILNPAPVKQPLPAKLLAQVDILTPNEIEASYLTGIDVINFESAKQAAAKLVSYGVSDVIITLGPSGAIYTSKDGNAIIPAPKVNAIDTTGAGDTFNAALATAITEGMAITQAVEFANHAAALSVTKLGTQPSIPKRDAVEAFMDKVLPASERL